MRIGGLQKMSLIDYPGMIGAIVFTVGCNFRCPYCHNPELVDETVENEMNEITVLDFLAKRKGALEALTITGGEPTLHDDLIPFMQSVKDLGYKIKLDSNGTNPSVLKSVIKKGLVDYIAMDIKAPIRKYDFVTGRPTDKKKIKESIKLIMNSGVDYEFRTTIVKSLLPKEDFKEIGEDIKGAKLYVLQKFVPTKILNPQFLKKVTYSDEDFELIRNDMESFVTKCTIR